MTQSSEAICIRCEYCLQGPPDWRCAKTAFKGPDYYLMGLKTYKLCVDVNFDGNCKDFKRGVPTKGLFR